MEFQRGVVLILLIDKELAFALAMAVHLEYQAAWLFTRFQGQSAEDPFGLRLLPGFSFPNDREDDHLCAGSANIASPRFFISSGVTSSMCCAIDQ